MAEIYSLEEICSKTHEILQVATKDLPIPDSSRVRDCAQNDFCFYV